MELYNKIEKNWKSLSLLLRMLLTRYWLIIFVFQLQNPSLIYKAAKIPGFAHLVDNAIEAGKDFAKQNKNVDRKAQLEYTLDRLCVNFGVEISKIVPGM